MQTAARLPRDQSPRKLCGTTILVYLINTPQRRLFSAGDEMCSDADHVDLILLRQSQNVEKDYCYLPPPQKKTQKSSNSVALTLLLNSTIVSSEMLLVPTMISESKAEVEKLGERQAHKNTTPPRFLSGTFVEMCGVAPPQLTACCRVSGHDGHPPIACRGRRCPGELPRACNRVRTAPRPRRRSSTGRC